MYLASLVVLLVASGRVIGNCDFPGAPAHSTVTFSSGTIGPGVLASYSCDPGLQLLGPAQKRCQENGTWTPEGIPFCVLNVAAGKAPMQSSTAQGGIPQKAVDGSTSGFYNPNTCTLTERESAPVWYVNLLEPFVVQLVRIDFGRSCCQNNAPVTIVVRVGNNRPDLSDNPVCSRFIGFMEEGRPLFLPCSPPIPGAFVSVHLESATAEPLSICEAFVYTDQALPVEQCPVFSDSSGSSTVTYNGKCYTFHSDRPLSFVNAQELCLERGGSLIDNSSPALQGFLSWELWRRHRNSPEGQYWMGAVRDPLTLSEWRWIDGRDVKLSFWSPPTTDGNCARFDGNKDWLWSQTDCSLPLNFICQYIPVSCGRPEQPPASALLASANFAVGSQVQYRCQSGHVMDGPGQRQCLSNGFYTGYPPACTAVECGQPASISNGTYRLTNGDRSLGSVLQYSCDPGQVMIGRGRLVCGSDQRWDGPPPSCQLRVCSEPQPILNGGLRLLNESSVVGAMVEYFCTDSKFTLIGEAILRCTASGRYQPEPPVCREFGTIEAVALLKLSSGDLTPTTSDSFGDTAVDSQSILDSGTNSNFDRSAADNLENQPIGDSDSIAPLENSPIIELGDEFSISDNFIGSTDSGSLNFEEQFSENAVDFEQKESTDDFVTTNDVVFFDTIEKNGGEFARNSADLDLEENIFGDNKVVDLTVSDQSFLGEESGRVSTSLSNAQNTKNRQFGFVFSRPTSESSGTNSIVFEQSANSVNQENNEDPSTFIVSDSNNGFSGGSVTDSGTFETTVEGGNENFRFSPDERRQSVDSEKYTEFKDETTGDYTVFVENQNGDGDDNSEWQVTSDSTDSGTLSAASDFQPSIIKTSSSSLFNEVPVNEGNRQSEVVANIDWKSLLPSKGDIVPLSETNLGVSDGEEDEEGELTAAAAAVLTNQVPTVGEKTPLNLNRPVFPNTPALLFPNSPSTSSSDEADVVEPSINPENGELDLNSVIVPRVTDESSRTGDLSGPDDDLYKRPELNFIPDTVNIRRNPKPGVDEPDNRLDSGILSANLNLGGIVALGVFGGFVFLAAVITTIVIMVRRSRRRGPCSGGHHHCSQETGPQSLASTDTDSSRALTRFYHHPRAPHHHHHHRRHLTKDPIRHQHRRRPWSSALSRSHATGPESDLVANEMDEVSAPAPSEGQRPHHHHHRQQRHHHHHHHHHHARRHDPERKLHRSHVPVLNKQHH